MIEVGINSYCTLEEADKYIKEHYISTSNEVDMWNSLEDTDKEVYLISSADSLNGLNYKGRKKTRGQPLAFPRINYMMPGVIYLPIALNQIGDYTLVNGFGNGDGLECAKAAQIENALAHCLIDPKTVSEVRTRVLSGISSERAGSISRSYNDISDNRKSNMMLKGIYNPDKVEAKLKAWLSTSIFSI